MKTNNNITENKKETGEPVFFSTQSHRYSIGSRISVCIPVKNESANIKSCLDSIKLIADEIVVIDTGSTDQTTSIIYKWATDNNFLDKLELKLCGNMFHDSDGNFHFGDAKTYAIRQASCDFVMWLDASDVVNDPTELRNIFNEVTIDNKEVCFTAITKLRDLSFIRNRIFPRKCSKFEGEIHEDVVFSSDLSVYNTNVSITHKDSERDRESNLKRNLKTLLKNWENEKTSRVAYYIASTYADLGDLIKAAQYYNYKISNFPITNFGETLKTYEHLCGCHERLYTTTRRRDRIADMGSVAIKLIEFAPIYREGYYYLGKSHFLNGDKNSAKQCFTKCLHLDKPNSSVFVNKDIYSNTHIEQLISYC